jgi:putative protein-disulfide isomerase
MSTSPLDRPILYYVHDPMCAWCWAFRPVWLGLRATLGTRVDVRFVLGGLAPDSDAPMPQETREYLQETWRRIRVQVPGTRFNFDFWSHNIPRRSTWPACRAVIAAERQAAGAGERMVLAIQQAYYLEAKNPADQEVLVALSEGLELDTGLFREDLAGTAVRAELDEQFRLRDQLGAQGFPSLILNSGSRFWPVPVHYREPSAMLAVIEDALARQAASDRRP